MKLVIYHETLWQSIATDLATFGCLIGSILIGKWIGSEALQWIAGIMAVIAIITLKHKYRQTFTSVEKAKAFLDSLKIKP